MTDHQRLVGKVQSRIAMILGIRSAVVALSVWLLCWGGVVLIARGAFGVPWEPLLWGLAGLPFVAGVGMILGSRRVPSAETVRAMLDHQWECGGLLMSAAEADAGRWSVAPSTGVLPRVQWRNPRSMGILVCSLAFLVASFFVPAQLFSKLGPERLVVDQEVERLAEKIELLKEEEILPVERAKTLEEALEQLRKEASGRDPAKTWEAMDHLEQSIAKASADAAEKAGRDAKSAAESEELAAAIEQAQSEMAPSDLAEAMESLAGDLKKALQESALLSGELSKEMKEQIEQGKLSAEQLKELAKSLGECKQCNLEKVGSLAKAKMIDPRQLKQLQKECQIDPTALAKLLSECQGNGELKQCLAAGNRPGKGGVSRGRGDAAMTWTDGSEREGTAFKESMLPPGAISSLKDSKLQGLSLTAPTTNDSGDSPAGGALDLSTAGRGTARTQVILPEHRKVIQRYFSRTPSPGTSSSSGTDSPSEKTSTGN